MRAEPAVSTSAKISRSSATALVATRWRAGCEYDGRLSIVRFRRRWLLFARANLRDCAPRGGRFVQVATSDDLSTWSPFRLLHVRGFEPAGADVYFWAAQRNPVDGRSLLALMPLSEPPRACIGLAFSRDGHAWSAIVPLRLSLLAPGGRTVDHPVARGVVRHGRTVHVYVQLHVPGVTAEYTRPRLVRYALPTATLAELTRTALDGLATKTSRLTR